MVNKPPHYWRGSHGRWCLLCEKVCKAPKLCHCCTVAENVEKESSDNGESAT